MINPTEKMWTKYKREFSNKFYISSEDEESFISNLVKNTVQKEEMCICGYDYVFLNGI